MNGFPEHRLSVFDLKNDPYEYVDLIDTPRGQEVLDWAIEKHQSLREEYARRQYSFQG